MANYDLTYEGSRVQGILDTGNSLKDAGYIFRGEATPSTVPGTPTERVAYIGGPGTYTNFGGSITVGAGCICVFKYTGSAWSNQVINTGLSDAISSAINSEATARSEADTALQSAINSEATTRSEADTALQNAINSEATTRSEADTALQNAINAINNNIGNGYVFAGVATPSTSPVTGKVFYLTVQAGTYTNFEDSEETPLAVTAGINILKNTGTGWVLDQVIAIDDEPTQGSANLVKSGGVLNSIIQNGPAFDLSAHNAQGGVLATYADLSAALTALDALPADFKKGGMSVKFVQSSDNKYVQYRLMSDSFNTTVANWQGVDDEPTAESDNLLKSGGALSVLSGNLLIHLLKKSINPSGNITNNNKCCVIESRFLSTNYPLNISCINNNSFNLWIYRYSSSGTFISRDFLGVSENYFIDETSIVDGIIKFVLVKNVTEEFMYSELLALKIVINQKVTDTYNSVLTINKPSLFRNYDGELNTLFNNINEKINNVDLENEDVEVHCDVSKKTYFRVDKNGILHAPFGFGRKIKILFIGNSLCQNNVTYLPWLLKNTYPELDFTIGLAYIGGYTINDYMNYVVNGNKTIEIYSKSKNSISWVNFGTSGEFANIPLLTILQDEDWDIIVTEGYYRINYVEGRMEDVTQFAPFVEYLRNHVKPNNTLMFGYLVHQNYTNNMSDLIGYADAMSIRTPTELFFPSGVMTQELTQIVGQSNMTSDGLHNRQGFPCIIGSYPIMYQLAKLLSLPTNRLINNDLIIDSTIESEINPPKTYGDLYVSERKYYRYAQKVAIQSCKWMDAKLCSFNLDIFNF